MLWFVVNGRRYAVAYNHQKAVIEIRDRTQSGSALNAFSNATSITDVEDIFRQM